MRPLTDRLRQVVDRADDIGSRNLALMQESADLIEDLQSKLDRCRAELDDARKCADLWKADHDALALRLDKALALLDDCHDMMAASRSGYLATSANDLHKQIQRLRRSSAPAVEKRGLCPFGFAPNAFVDREFRCTKEPGHDGDHDLQPVASTDEEERGRRWVPKEWNPDLCVNCGQPYHAHNTLTNECPARASEGQPREWSCPKHGKFVNASGNCRDCEAERALSEQCPHTDTFIKENPDTEHCLDCGEELGLAQTRRGEWT
ncbi:MAG: hypothetical protein KDA32_13485 [Phycisphaerales bacterium]|nr:hypothetical protein [Phycisphaerales bacterium]